MKKRIGIPLTILILLLLVYTLKDIDFKEIYNLLWQINLKYFLLALLAGFVSVSLWNLRFKNTIKGYIDGRFFFLFKVLLAGILVNTITPGTGIGGEPIRAYYLNKRYKHPKTKILGYIIADKMFNAIAFSFFVIFSIIFIFFFLEIPSESKTISQTIIVSLVIISLILFIMWKNSRFEVRWISEKLYKLNSIKSKFRTLTKFEIYLSRKIHGFTHVLKEVVTDKHKIYFGIFISIVYRLIEYSVAYLVFLSLGTEVSFIPIIAIVTISHLLGDLSPTPGGIGVVESSLILLYAAIGISAPLATLAALLSRLVYYFYALLIGGLSLLALKWKIK